MKKALLSTFLSLALAALLAPAAGAQTPPTAGQASGVTVIQNAEITSTREIDVETLTPQVHVIGGVGELWVDANVAGRIGRALALQRAGKKVLHIQFITNLPRRLDAPLVLNRTLP
ncbi:MAG: hypothetical protein IH793_12205 [Acidobacteria bacterium]|nr:hypothetical protein [Acidobacteriota bacterium]